MRAHSGRNRDGEAKVRMGMKSGKQGDDEAIPCRRRAKLKRKRVEKRCWERCSECDWRYQAEEERTYLESEGEVWL